MLPALHERREVRKLDGLDLLPQRGERPPASDLDHPSGAPFEILNLTPEFSAYQLAGSLPLSEPGFDPLDWPSIATVDLLNGHRSGLCQEARENFPACDRSVDGCITQNFRNHSFGVLLDQLGSTAHPRQLLGPEGRDVTQICFRQNEAPFLRSFRSEPDRNEALGLQ